LTKSGTMPNVFDGAQWSPRQTSSVNPQPCTHSTNKAMPLLCSVFASFMKRRQQKHEIITVLPQYVDPPGWIRWALGKRDPNPVLACSSCFDRAVQCMADTHDLRVHSHIFDKYIPSLGDQLIIASDGE